MTLPDLAPRRAFGGVVAVWAAALAMAVAVGVFAPLALRGAWVSIALAGCVILSFAVQLWYGRAHRFISRVALSMLGSLLIVAIVSGAFGLAALMPS